MNGSATLAELASLHGILTDYTDIWDLQHAVAEPTLVALLAELSVDANTPQAIEAAIQAYHAARWREILPAAMVVREGVSPWTVRLNLPAALDAVRLRWQLVEENGALHADQFTPNELPCLERHDAIVARELSLPLALARGYHRLILRDPDAILAEGLFAVTPTTCFLPAAVEGEGRVWGAVAQIYTLRSARNWGIGDFSDLGTVLEQCAQHGASIVGVNPLHALFPHNPAHASPYSPSSRLFLNVLYIDIERVVDFCECEAVMNDVHTAPFQSQLRALREAQLVDYPAVAATKLAILERLYAHFCAQHLAPGSPRAQIFQTFTAQGGEPLRRHALFEALQSHFHGKDPGVWGWPAWPVSYRDPDSREVARFAERHHERVTFYQYLQWQAELQLAEIDQRARDLGLGIGLYQDLAVSIDRGGAEAWANQDLYAVNVSVGAPPDAFNLMGQNWGLPPLRPARLRDAGYAPFIATLRQNMRHAGALRIDHVMGLARLYWIPAGMSPAEGAYVRYPLTDLLGIVTLESHRNQCMIVGEDLGTVPDDLRAALAAHGILSYRVLFFERTLDGDFLPPQEYPVDALVAASTHDLPTLAGYWEGNDLVLRNQLGLIPLESQRRQSIVERAQDRARLLLAIEHAGLLPDGATVNSASVPQMTPAFARSLLLYLARTPSKILVIQLEDVLCAREQVNLPATTDEHPNWRRKLELDLERLGNDERFVMLARALTEERCGQPPRRPRGDVAVTCIPRATYRLQLHQHFTFLQAAALIPYLAMLGVSHVYCSPYLRARPGSTHGYDIIDHNSLNPEIGSREDFEHFVSVLRAHGMGQILDMVPNHMGVMGADNAWWLDVLENGPASIYADYFDIDWQPVNVHLAHRILIPVLGDHYGLVLERGEFKLAFDATLGTFSVWYFEHRLPVDPQTYPRILERAVRALGALDPAATALANVSAAFMALPAREQTPPASAERRRDQESHQSQLALLVAATPTLRVTLERVVEMINGSAEDPKSFEALHDLLELQAYRLAYWRVASDEVNYRRFFDINELAGLRVEHEQVFEDTHKLVFELLVSGKVDGIRLDHPDGLYDPAQYFKRLQTRYAQHLGLEAAPAHDDRPARPLYVVIEKIMAGHEHVPEDWAVHGTTGYRFAGIVNGLFVDTAARGKFDRIYRAFIGETLDFDEMIYQGKRAIMRAALASELTVLASALLRIARADRRTRDYTFNTLRQALTEVVACFPVYRTYISGSASAQDRRQINWAIAHATHRSRAADTSIFDFIRAALLAQIPQDASPAQTMLICSFAMKFQQFTGPVTAKGVEDTAFYRYNRLVSLNEVGGDPKLFGFTVSAFHGASADRAARWPHTMLATSTHDNKRAEDVRARIDVLSEMPGAWRLLLRRWSRINRACKRIVDGAAAPSRNDEYLLYQTLLGTFPLEALDEVGLAAYCTRIEAYMVKAVREAKVQSSWISVSEAYETATVEFVRKLLGGRPGNLFLDSLITQARPLAWFGMLNSLSMTLLKLVSPGVPDIYQGTEIWDFSLVDPDNRRPVDYARRRLMLEEMGKRARPECLAQTARELANAPDDGRAKLWLIWRSLGVRQRYPAVFENGDYAPLAASGVRADHVVAFARRYGDAGVIALVGRRWGSLGLEAGMAPLGAGVWGDTAIDAAPLPRSVRLVNVLTGEPVAIHDRRILIADAFANFPAALMLYNLED